MAMVPKIDGSGYYDHTINQTRKVNTVYQKDSTPPFSMKDYQEDGVIYEPSGSKDNRKERITAEATKRAVEQTERKKTFAESGVRLDLSQDAVNAQQSGIDNKGMASIWEQVKKLATSIREFFASLWSGESTAATTNETVAQVEPLEKEALTNSTGMHLENGTEDKETSGSQVVDETIIGQVGKERALTYDEKVAIFLKENATMMLTNDPEEMKRFMVNYDGRKLAKKSNTVTYYNKQGKIVEPTGSDKQRILQTERATTKA